MNDYVEAHSEHTLKLEENDTMESFPVYMDSLAKSFFDEKSQDLFIFALSRFDFDTQIK